MHFATVKLTWRGCLWLLPVNYHLSLSAKRRLWKCPSYLGSNYLQAQDVIVCESASAKISPLSSSFCASEFFVFGATFEYPITGTGMTSGADLYDCLIGSRITTSTCSAVMSSWETGNRRHLRDLPWPGRTLFWHATRKKYTRGPNENISYQRIHMCGLRTIHIWRLNETVYGGSFFSFRIVFS